jgi:hypothetical protein
MFNVFTSGVLVEVAEVGATVVVGWDLQPIMNEVQRIMIVNVSPIKILDFLLSIVLNLLL